MIILAPPETNYRASIDLQFLNFEIPTIDEIKAYVKRGQEYALKEYVEPKVSSIQESVIDGQPSVLWTVSSGSYREGVDDGIHSVQERVLILCDNENSVYMFTIDSLTELAEKYLTIGSTECFLFTPTIKSKIWV